MTTNTISPLLSSVVETSKLNKYQYKSDLNRNMIKISRLVGKLLYSFYKNKNSTEK